MRGIVASLLLCLVAGCGGKTDEAPEEAFMKSPAPTLPETFHGEPLAHWIQAARSDDATTRAEAAWALGELGASQADAHEALTPLLSDSNANVRFAGLAALQRMGSVPPALVPAVLAAERSDEVGTRGLSASLGPLLAAEDVVAVLATEPTDSDAFRAAKGIAAKGGADVAASLRAVLVDGTDPAREQEICEVLGEIGPDAASAIGELIKRLVAKPPLGPTAATALGRIGPKAKPALEAFLVSDAAKASAQAKLLAQLALSRIK
ncbi:MAG: HEAT repeat domain-containing protein [Planctomycetota bacterium]|nr:HEAT repeat domain-containing protein [Planctomycetota bacterium]